MQKLKWSGLSDELPSQVSSVLAFRALSEPLLPNLRYLSLGGNFIPFIPLILSPTISVIKFKFYELEPSETPAAASIIAAFPEVCPNLQHIRLQYLPRDPMITAAASELLLTTNRDTLRSFHVDSPLTEEAHEVISNLPDLRGLSVVVKGDASLPPAIPPNLTNLAVTYDGDWSPMFHGATLKKLESITFDCESDQADDFLETFKNIALATSISATLSQFSFYTTHPWRPNYRSLLLFTQMKELYMHFFCEGGCSSTIDDDTVTDLARAMPMLEVLYLGRTLCKTPRGVTAKGLAALAHHCRRLSRLRIHFQVVNPDPPKTPVVISGGGSTIPREDQCALTVLEVGEIYIPEESMLVVGLTLLRIFPRLETISSGYGGRRWQEIEDALCCSKRFIDHLSKNHSFDAS